MFPLSSFFYIFFRGPRFLRFFDLFLYRSLLSWFLYLPFQRPLVFRFFEILFRRFNLWFFYCSFRWFGLPGFFQNFLGGFNFLWFLSRLSFWRLDRLFMFYRRHALWSCSRLLLGLAGSPGTGSRCSLSATFDSLLLKLYFRFRPDHLAGWYDIVRDLGLSDPSLEAAPSLRDALGR